MTSAAAIMNQLLAENAILEKGEDGGLKPIPAGSLNGKIIGLYFSAHWCPPCRKLTPILAGKYKEIVSAGHNFEIIFISGDQSKKEAGEYFAEHPWKMLDFDKDESNGALNELFEVSGIPHLVLLDENFQLLTQDGIELVMKCRDFARIRTYEAEKRALAGTAADILGPILDANGIVEKVGEGGEKRNIGRTQLAGKVIALYFSAHWCPPCRQLTPILAQKYKEVVAQGHNFDIIFVSSDRSQADADEYFKEHPWKMVDYANREAKSELGDRFDVEGIPTLVLLDENLNLITKDGIEVVLRCKDFSRIKFYEEDKRALAGSCADILGPVLDANGIVEKVDEAGNEKRKIGRAQLAGKLIALYFSAHWCPPCRQLTPMLAAKYKELIAAGTNFDIIFVSSDRSQADADEYFNHHHPWKMLDYANRDAKSELANRFDVQGIPTLVLLDENLNVITKDGIEPLLTLSPEEFRNIRAN